MKLRKEEIAELEPEIRKFMKGLHGLMSALSLLAKTVINKMEEVKLIDELNK